MIVNVEEGAGVGNRSAGTIPFIAEGLPQHRVLAGAGGRVAAADTMLASPIILYDYPQIAPESQGNLFDSTEIDEILSLRIMTLTDEEKQAVAGSDECAGHLARAPMHWLREQLASLHGTVRD